MCRVVYDARLRLVASASLALVVVPGQFCRVRALAGNGEGGERKFEVPDLGYNTM